MSIIIELEEVKESKGGAVTKETKVFEGKLNYHAMKLSATYYDKLNGDKDPSDPSRMTLIEAYNSMVMGGDNSFERVTEILWFMFAPVPNGGMSLETVEAFVNDTGETEEGFDNLVEDVLVEMEKSGFFIKTLRLNYKGTINHVLPMTKENLVDPKTGEMSPEGNIFLERLNRLITRGVEKGFLPETDLPKED